MEESLCLNIRVILQLQINLLQSVHFLIQRNKNLEKLGILLKDIRKKVKRKLILKVKRNKLSK